MTKIKAENPLAKYHSSFPAKDEEIRAVRIVGFDTEDDTKGTPLSCAFYSDEGPFYTTRMDEAIDYIYNTPVSSCFVAHNLEYDIGNLFKHCDWKYIEDMIYAGKLLRVSLVSSKHYFINSSSFFQGSLKKMGETIGCKKLEGDVFNKEYNIRDAEIVYRFMTMFQRQLNNDLNINLGITIGQLAMSAYRRNYMVKKKQVTYNARKCLRAYYGGRVEIFYKGAVEKVTVCDINSSYPNVMRNFLYPDTTNIEPSTLETHEHGIGKFKVHVPQDLFIPPLPYKSPDTKRLFFPVGDFTGWWTYAEMRYAQSIGIQVLKEYEGHGTNNGVRPFVNFVDDFYDKRLASKKRKNKFEDLFYKLIQNNLYGKFCQHHVGSSISRSPLTATQAERKRALLDKKIGSSFYSYKSTKEEPPVTANFMWGIHVTAYARLELQKGMMAIHNAGGRLIYCDTDSIMFNGLKKNPLPLSNKLGDWDEEKFDLGVFRQLKGYLLCNKNGDGYDIEKCACKGVRTDYAYDFIIRGAAKFLKPMRFKESIVRINAKANQGKGEEFEREMGTNYWRDVEKAMQSVYIKRVADKKRTEAQGQVMIPLDIDMIPEMEKKAKKQERQPNIEKELKQHGYNIKRKRVKKFFRNIEVPPDWFRRTQRKGKRGPVSMESTRYKWLKSNDCLDLKKGQRWFAGHFMGIEEGYYGKYYRIFLTHFKGSKAPVNFWGAISVKFFRSMGFDQNFVGNYLDVKLLKNYLEKKSLNIKVQISESEFGVPSDDEIDLAEKLGGAETENLMNADWSFLDGIPK